MKVLAIGDIHGLDTWKQIVEKETYDICVFIGDYFDSFDIDMDTQIANFKEIIEFKRRDYPNVILLLGNHDLHYLHPTETYSGFNALRAVDIKEVLDDALPTMQKAFSFNDFLFTHAGVTNTWLNEHGVDTKYLATSINQLPLQSFLFQPGTSYDRTGDNITQGPMWVRPKSLRLDQVDGWHQVVGHTQVPEIITTPNNVTQIDALPSGQYLVIDDGDLITKTI